MHQINLKPTTKNQGLKRAAISLSDRLKGRHQAVVAAVQINLLVIRKDQVLKLPKILKGPEERSCLGLQGLLAARHHLANLDLSP